MVGWLMVVGIQYVVSDRGRGRGGRGCIITAGFVCCLSLCSVDHHLPQSIIAVYLAYSGVLLQCPILLQYWLLYPSSW